MCGFVCSALSHYIPSVIILFTLPLSPSPSLPPPSFCPSLSPSLPLSLLPSLPLSLSQILRKAVYGMLPKNLLRKKRMRRLHLFPGPTTPTPPTSLTNFLDLVQCTRDWRTIVWRRLGPSLILSLYLTCSFRNVSYERSDCVRCARARATAPRRVLTRALITLRALNCSVIKKRRR